MPDFCKLIEYNSEVPVEIQKKQFPAPSRPEQEQMSRKTGATEGLDVPAEKHQDVRHRLTIKSINWLGRSKKWVFPQFIKCLPTQVLHLLAAPWM
jgi:hypothetical protein